MMKKTERKVSIASEFVIRFSDEQKAENYFLGPFSRYFQKVSDLNEAARVVAEIFNRECENHSREFFVDELGGFKKEEAGNIAGSRDGEIWSCDLGDKWGTIFIFIEMINDSVHCEEYDDSLAHFFGDSLERLENLSIRK